MSKKTLRKAYQKELAMALRTKRRKDNSQENIFAGSAEQSTWSYNG